MPKKHPYYPIFLDLEGRNALVVGGGSVSARKAETLLGCGARVTVVAPSFGEDIDRLSREDRLTVRHRPYEASDLEGTDIVIAATDDQQVNTRIAADCRSRRIPVNVVDVTPLCDFIVPATIEIGSIQVAVSTGGRSPALARRLRLDLQRTVGAEYAEANDIFGALREEARTAATLPTDADRKRFFDGIITAGILEMLREGRRREALEIIAGACEAAAIQLPAGIRDELNTLRRR